MLLDLVLDLVLDIDGGILVGGIVGVLVGRIVGVLVERSGEFGGGAVGVFVEGAVAAVALRVMDGLGVCGRCVYGWYVWWWCG